MIVIMSWFPIIRVAGPLVWNSIADCLHDLALELASFKHQLKTFLFARYY